MGLEPGPPRRKAITITFELKRINEDRMVVGKKKKKKILVTGKREVLF